MNRQRGASGWSGSPPSDGDRGTGLHGGATRGVGTPELLLGQAPRHAAGARADTTPALAGCCTPRPTYLETQAVRIERP